MILKDTKKHECGCISEREGNVWSLKEYCKQHMPNYAKKADKKIHLRHKKTGRGYTKSPKPLNER